MHNTVTHIIHIGETLTAGFNHADLIFTAWYVNFNVPLKTFKPSIGGVQTLINFALSSSQTETPRLVFVSSRGALRSEQVLLISAHYSQ